MLNPIYRIYEGMKIRWKNSIKAEFLLLGKAEISGMTLLEGNIELWEGNMVQLST